MSKFSRVSLFSGLNNLTDITLDPGCSAICGYTEANLDVVFAPELPGLDREVIRDWYNGYAWRGEDKVYNPFDILLLFRNREFGAWWFETGTPAFLVETLFERRVSALTLDGMVSSGELLSTFDVDDMPTGDLEDEAPERCRVEMPAEVGRAGEGQRMALHPGQHLVHLTHLPRPLGKAPVGE